jgi:hypothetical protein
LIKAGPRERTDNTVGDEASRDDNVEEEASIQNTQFFITRLADNAQMQHR